MNDLVECRSESEYAERPVALTWEGSRLEIDEILTRWRSPNGKHFRVRTNDLRVFDLWYNEAEDTWEVVQQ